MKGIPQAIETLVSFSILTESWTNSHFENEMEVVNLFQKAVENENIFNSLRWPIGIWLCIICVSAL